MASAGTTKAITAGERIRKAAPTTTPVSSQPRASARLMAQPERRMAPRKNGVNAVSAWAVEVQ